MAPPLLIGGLAGLSGLPRYLRLLLGLLALDLEPILGSHRCRVEREHDRLLTHLIQ